jgi:crossover junction endodeoxyribonuclease RuvC
VSNKQRILGIDPGSRVTGFGVLDFVGSSATYVTSGVVQSIDGGFSERLKVIFDAVTELVSEYQPDVVSVESVFVHKNPGSALKLGHARSAAICATFQSDAIVFEYAPREIKLAVVGTGSATKEQVQHMVVSILELEGIPSSDAADALATALCHGHQIRYGMQIKESAVLAGSG